MKDERKIRERKKDRREREREREREICYYVTCKVLLN